MHLIRKKIETNTVNWNMARNKHKNCKMKLDYILSNVDITSDFVLDIELQT